MVEIKNYLNKIMDYDWNKFNQLDFLGQLDELSLLHNNLDKIIKENSNDHEMYFKNANNVIDSYSNQLSKLKILGRSKHNFYIYTLNEEKGWEGILWQLKNVVDKAHYKALKKKSNLNCDCTIALKHNKDPEIQNLKNIGWINDQYYFPELYTCKECNFKWITYSIDDDLGGTAWEKYSPKDEALTVYY